MISLVITIVLTVAVLVLIWYAISALIQLRKTLLSAEKTLMSMDVLTTNIDKKLEPLLGDMHSVVKRADRELGRVDDVMSTVKDIGDKVNAVTRVVHEVVSSPLIKVASISAGAKEAIKKMVGR